MSDRTEFERAFDGWVADARRCQTAELFSPPRCDQGLGLSSAFEHAEFLAGQAAASTSDPAVRVVSVRLLLEALGDSAEEGRSDMRAESYLYIEPRPAYTMFIGAREDLGAALRRIVRLVNEPATLSIDQLRWEIACSTLVGEFARAESFLSELTGRSSISDGEGLTLRALARLFQALFDLDPISRDSSGEIYSSNLPIWCPTCSYPAINGKEGHHRLSILGSWSLSGIGGDADLLAQAATLLRAALKDPAGLPVGVLHGILAGIHRRQAPPNLNEAARCLEEALRAGPEAHGCFGHQLDYHFEGDLYHPEAAYLAEGEEDARFRDATEVLGGRALMFALTDVRESTGLTDRAIEGLEGYVGAQPSDAGAWERLADLQRQGGKYEAALDSLRNLVEAKPTADRGAVAIALAIGGREAIAREGQRFLASGEGLLLKQTISLWWPSFDRLSEDARSTWALGTFLLAPEQPYPAQAHASAAANFAKVFEIELRAVVFEQFRLLTRSDPRRLDEAKAERQRSRRDKPSLASYVDDGTFTLGQMLHELSVEHRPPGLSSRFGSWLHGNGLADVVTTADWKVRAARLNPIRAHATHSYHNIDARAVHDDARALIDSLFAGVPPAAKTRR